MNQNYSQVFTANWWDLNPISIKYCVWGGLRGPRTPEHCKMASEMRLSQNT